MAPREEHPYSIESRALKTFGETWNVEFAGYILADGVMLNFAPAGWQRTEDHRAIGQFFKSAEGHEAVDAFLRRGNVRVMCSPTSYGFEYVVPPTAAQRRVMAEAQREADRRGIDLYVDRSDRNGRTAAVYGGAFRHGR